MYAYIGRQPLYNHEYVLYGYELLHRDNMTKNVRSATEEEEELRSICADAVGMFDFEKLTEGMPVHIRFTPNLLMGNLPYLIPPGQVVVEFSASTSLSSELAEKLADLKQAGYRLALTGYDPRGGLIKLNKILAMFDIIYINVHQFNRLQILDTIKHLRSYTKTKLLAEQVDTEADFDKVKELHFSYFQGLLFGMPDVFRNEVDLAKTPYGKLYNALSVEGLRPADCAQLILDDPLLTYMYLERMPTPKERREAEAELQRSIVTVGSENLRKWSCLLMLRQLNVYGDLEPSVQAYCFALFIEKLILASETKADPLQGFLIAVFSRLPVIIDTPLENIMGYLRFNAEIISTLIGVDNIYAKFLRYAKEYEETKQPPNMPDLPLYKEAGYLKELYLKCRMDAENAFTVLNPFRSQSPVRRR